MPIRLTIVWSYPSSYYFCTTTAGKKRRVVIPTRLRTSFFVTENSQKTRFFSSCHDTKRERSRPPTAESEGASKVRHFQEIARREVDLSSSYLEDGSKSGLNRTLRLLSCKGLYIYISIDYM